jgi:hypothetical protein
MIEGKRLLAAAFAATLALGTSAARAQIAPGDTDAGTQLGLAEENNSGQTGFVTLFRRPNASTLVVIRLASEPQGRVEAAHIHRGQGCDSLASVPTYPLAPVINGLSKTLVKASMDRLLSGNYNVNVHASTNAAIYVSCGHLYR